LLGRKVNDLRYGKDTKECVYVGICRIISTAVKAEWTIWTLVGFQ